MPQGNSDGIMPSILRSTIKQILTGLIPGRKSSHLTETLAVGFGYANNAAYLADTKDEHEALLLPVGDMAAEAMALRLSSLCSTTWADEMLLVSTALQSLAGIMPGRVVPVGPSSTLLAHNFGKAEAGKATEILPLNGLDIRTSDGRPSPHAPGRSDNGIAAIDLIYAPPGKGKSILINAAHIAIASADLDNLPFIRFVDIGPSCKGTISSLRRRLPDDRKDEAVHIRIRMIEEHAVNPFDTQLGCRYPMPSERASLVNLLSVMGTQDGDATPPHGMPDIVGFAVDELYAIFSDDHPRSRPKYYRRAVDPLIDLGIADLDIATDQLTTWWSLTDAFFSNGLTDLAIRAQRHAVPLLEDIGTVLNAPRMRDVFGSALTKYGEQTLRLFERMYINAIRAYPVLRSPTKLDLGFARVVAFDLDEVSPRGSGDDKKQTALMYLWAMRVLGKNFEMDQDLLDATQNSVRFVPDLYRGHHSNMVHGRRKTSKHLVLDEFHRVGWSEPVHQQVLIEMREGLKWGICVSVSSQRLSDFDTAMVELSNGIWILGVGNDRTATEAVELFELSEQAYGTIRSQLTGPGREGLPIYSCRHSEDYKHEQLVHLRMQPSGVWEISTSTTDVMLRDKLTAAMDVDEAFERLSRIFPRGSARKEVERRMQIRMEHDLWVPNEETVIDELVSEIVAVSAQ